MINKPQSCRRFSHSGWERIPTPLRCVYQTIIRYGLLVLSRTGLLCGIVGCVLSFFQPLYSQEIFNYGTTVGPFVSTTQGVERIVPGRIRVGTGFASLFYGSTAERSSFRLNLVPIRFDIGVATNTEFSLRWDVRQRVETGGTVSTGVGDLVVSTRYHILEENARHPGLGICVTTKLPNASDKGSWLGTDNTDFIAALIVARGEWVVNLGLAILGSPVDPPLDSSNDDFAVFGLAWRHQFSRRWVVESEVAGFASDRGREDYAVAIGSAWYRLGPGDMGVQVRKGITKDAEDFGTMVLYRLPFRQRRTSSQ